MSFTAILILNWNGSRDTRTCLDSLLPHLDGNDHVFIIDNGSTDTSVAEIRDYFENVQQPLLSTDAENLKATFRTGIQNYLVQNTANLGFGAGNNVVLRQLRSLSSEFEFAWLLNNDAVAEANTLNSLRKTLQRQERAGAAGSLILNYPDNKLIQCSGVNYHKFFGVSKLVNKNAALTTFDRTVPVAFDYLNGASILFSLKALDKTGFFDERFFLYSEELDLELRMQQQGFELVLDPNSVVYHRLGGGTQSRKYLFYYYYNTSAILLNRKHYSLFYTFSAVISLSAITFIRAFPSVKSFLWGIKGIIKGLRTR